MIDITNTNKVLIELLTDTVDEELLQYGDTVINKSEAAEHIQNEKNAKCLLK